MKATQFLATSLNRRDEIPNKELAKEIIASNKLDWVRELVENLTNKNKNIQSDSIKVLYEIGDLGHPKLIAPYYINFITTLGNKNNRLVWGAMAALNFIALEKPHELYENLEIIDAAIEKGSVITIDGGVSILAKLASVKEYQREVLPKLIHQLAKCPAKQFSMYIEKSEIAMSATTKNDFLGIIDIRYKDLDKDSQRKRIDRMLKKLKSIT